MRQLLATQCVLAVTPSRWVRTAYFDRRRARMIWETLRTFTPVWILRASLILLLQTWAFGKIHTLDSGRATSSRERRSAATPNQASTMAAMPIRAAPKK